MRDDRAEEIKQNILSPSQWTRILFMAFYAVACWVITIVLSFVIVAQILISLITGEDNDSLRTLGKKLADYFHDALCFLVFATNDKPPPFSEDSGPGDDDDDDGAVYTAPANDSGPAASAGDDVFADISFTDSADEGNDDDVSEEDNSVEFTSTAKESSSTPDHTEEPASEKPENGSDQESDDDRKF